MRSDAYELSTYELLCRRANCLVPLLTGLLELLVLTWKVAANAPCQVGGIICSC
jgi:hypothetical protein